MKAHFNIQIAKLLQNISVLIKNVCKLPYYSLKCEGMSAILNNQIQPVSETRWSGLAMMSLLSYWLTTKPFALSLYKCDTTRMVGRLFNSTAIHISLSSKSSILPQPPPLTIPPISPHSLHFIIPPPITT